MQHRGSLAFDTDDVGSIGPVHGDGNVSGLQMRRLSGGQSRKAKTRNKEAALPNELSISFHFAPTKISFSPAETQENSLVWTLAAPSLPHKAASAYNVCKTCSRWIVRQMRLA
jgi:hypothetical protein